MAEGEEEFVSKPADQVLEKPIDVLPGPEAPKRQIVLEPEDILRLNDLTVDETFRGDSLKPFQQAAQNLTMDDVNSFLDNPVNSLLVDSRVVYNGSYSQIFGGVSPNILERLKTAQKEITPGSMESYFSKHQFELLQITIDPLGRDKSSACWGTLATMGQNLLAEDIEKILKEDPYFSLTANDYTVSKLNSSVQGVLDAAYSRCLQAGTPTLVSYLREDPKRMLSIFYKKLKDPLVKQAIDTVIREVEFIPKSPQEEAIVPKGETVQPIVTTPDITGVIDLEEPDGLIMTEESVETDFPIAVTTPTGVIKIRRKLGGWSLSGGQKRAEGGIKGGSTSTAQEGIYLAADGHHPVRVFIKVTYPEDVKPEPWIMGPSEAGVLSLNLPYNPQLYDYGWLDNSGTRITHTIDPIRKPLFDAPGLPAMGATLPEFVLVMEQFDPENTLFEVDLHTLVRAGLDSEVATSSGIRYLNKDMRLQERGFGPSEQLSEELILALGWSYFNALQDVHDAGWTVRDFDAGKNICFDLEQRRIVFNDYGMATPVSQDTEAFVDNLLGKDITEPMRKRQQELRTQRLAKLVSSASTPLSAREGLLREIGAEFFKKLFNYHLPVSGNDDRPTGEKLTARLRQLVDRLWNAESIQAEGDIRDEIGKFILKEFPNGSLAEEIINNNIQDPSHLRKT